MSWRRQLAKLGALSHRRKPVDDLEEEIRSHLEMEERENLESGVPPEEAHYAALRCFGNVTLAEERTREMWRWNSLETLWQDFRYGLRMLAKNPSFTVIAVLTLALGIGANSAIFNVLDAVLLRSLPVADPQNLVLLTDPEGHGRWFGSQNGDRSLVTFSEFEYLRDHNNLFDGMFAADSELAQLEVGLGSGAADVAGIEQNARVRLVSGGYFSTLGVKAARGRLFGTEVDRTRGASPVAVISYAIWREWFGLDPAILGKTIRMHETPFEIIGIAEPGFFGETVGQVPDIWVPITMQAAIYPGVDLLTAIPGLDNQYIWLQLMARLKPGVTPKQASAGINVAFKQCLQLSLGSLGTPKERRTYLESRIVVQSGARGISMLHESFGDPLKLLMALVALVLLIASANVANLLLARGTARQREFAVRIAIGAGRSRLLRQVLVESLLLALLGAALGLAISRWADALLLRMVTGFGLGPESIQLSLQQDFRALAFTLAVSVLAALIFGLIPAYRASRLDVSPALKSSSTGAATEAARRLPAGKLFVIGQVAVSLILLVAAGLFVHSLARLSAVRLGYNREKLLLFRIDAAAAGYKGDAHLRLEQDLLARFSAVPGVRAATLSSNGLFQGSDSGDPIWIEGYTPKSGEEIHSLIDHVGPGYFSTVGIPLLVGREIGVQDTGHGPRAAVINQSFAREFFPTENPLGKHMRDIYPGNPGEAEIVGVVADSKLHSLRETSHPRIYFPIFNPMWEQTAVSFEIRTLADAASVSSALRKVIGDTNTGLLPINIETMSGLVDRSLGSDRFIVRLSSAFGLLAMLLASIGLYGVMAYTVARRSRDIGIRMALGARPHKILWAVLRESLTLVLFGIALGLPVALAGTRLIKSLLFGLGTVDTVVLAGATVVLGLVAVLAGLLPARRASHVDPMVALRYE